MLSFNGMGNFLSSKNIVKGEPTKEEAGLLWAN